MKRRGFTFTELIMTVAIMGTVTAMAIPKSDDIKRRTTASQILRDVEDIRKGTFRFYSDSGYFPTEEVAGVVPESMTEYLPSGFSFTKKGWTIDYENWTSTMPSIHVKSRVQIGISISIPDPRLGATAMAMYGNNPKFSVGSKYIFLVVGL